MRRRHWGAAVSGIGKDREHADGLSVRRTAGELARAQVQRRKVLHLQLPCHRRRVVYRSNHNGLIR